MAPRKRKSQPTTDERPAKRASTRSTRKKKADPEPEVEPDVEVEAEAGPSTVVETEEAFESTHAEPEVAMPVDVEGLIEDEEERDTFAAMAPADEKVTEVEAVVEEDGTVVVESVEEIVEKQLTVQVEEDEGEVVMEQAREATPGSEAPAEEAPAGAAADVEASAAGDATNGNEGTANSEAAEDDDADMDGAQAADSATPGAGGSAAPLTMEERKANFKKLQSKMRDSFQANRKDLVAEHTKLKTSARELARLEKKRKLAEVLRDKQDAEERGEDPERKKNWEWSIEENEEWEKKQARKKKRADFSFNNDEDHARRRYKKDLDFLKPDLEAYNLQREAALGLAPGSLSGSNTPNGTLIASSSSGVVTVAQRAAAEDLYRDANSLVYADNKPSEEAIDRVVSKMNMDLDRRAKFSRKRMNEEEGDITYINERNRVFNKKIARYYDKYTSEIRASFERGTAL